MGERAPAVSRAGPDLEAVAQLLYCSAGITRKRSYPGHEFYFRAAACTGALYEVELYLVCGDLSNLAAGIYHFAPAEFGLRCLRSGDYLRVLLETPRRRNALAHAPLPLRFPFALMRNVREH